MGSMFGLEKIQIPNCSPPPFLDGNALLLANARSGIALLIDRLSPGHVWMPSYLCEAMVKTVHKSMAELKFYEINLDLVEPSLEWIAEVQQGDLVIVIDYFGFPCDENCITLAKKQGAWVLEDACQALLSSHVGHFSDFVLFSPRKFLGVPDGGILISNCKIDFQTIQLMSPPADWWLKAFYALVLRREFDLYGGNRNWFDLFQETELRMPVGPFAMNETTKMLLEHGFDYLLIIKKRIENYLSLLDELNDVALFSNIDQTIVPFGFPIKVRNRDKIRQMLFENEIYPPIHWSIQGIVPNNFRASHKLSDEIMTLPCDQRYDHDNMKKMASIILGGLREC